MSETDAGLIELPGQFAQVQLSGLKELVDHRLEGGSAVQFDGSKLERIDGAAVQFLLSVSKLQTDNKEPVVINANEVLLNALNDMGVALSISVLSEE